MIILHLFTFQTPIFTSKKNTKRHKINSRNFTYDGLTFSTSFLPKQSIPNYVIVFLYHFILYTTMPTHKSNDYKLTAVQHYLVEDLKYIRII